MSKPTKHKLVAFSLVELMASVAIVSVLATLALPRYRLFIATSRQAEAHANLGIIASLQQSYHLEYNRHHSGMEMGGGHTDRNCDDTIDGTGQRNHLGFRVTKCDKLRYTYKSSASQDTANNDGTVPSHLIYPNCEDTDGGTADIWRMSKDRELTQNTDENIIKQCDK